MDRRPSSAWITPAQLHTHPLLRFCCDALESAFPNNKMHEMELLLYALSLPETS